MRSIRLCSLLLLVALLLGACGNNQQTGGENAAVAEPSVAASIMPGGAASQRAAASPAVSDAASAAASAAPSPTIGPTAIPTPGAEEFANPVINQDFPDPDTLQVEATYYAYATNSGGTNVQSAISTNLTQWQIIGEALPALPLWATGGFTWAPEVAPTADGSYVMYFTARDTASNLQCIGVATSATPEGPFESTAEQPLVCPTDQGGAIDAATFVDEDGSRYVLWKNDGNCCGLPTNIYIQPVSADGLTLEGEPTQMIENDQIWEGSVVEAPTLWKHDGKYYLFYSANNYAGLDYAIGYAVADNVLGPYTKPLTEPWLSSTVPETIAAIGPGGQDILVDDDGDTWLMYHSWDPSVAYRRILLSELTWEGDVPVVQDPTLVPQPLP